MSALIGVLIAIGILIECRYRDIKSPSRLENPNKRKEVKDD